MDISHNGFLEIFRIKIRAQSSIFFFLRIVLYNINTHKVRERGKCTYLHSYISWAVNGGAELNVYGKVS